MNYNTNRAHRVRGRRRVPMIITSLSASRAGIAQCIPEHLTGLHTHRHLWPWRAGSEQGKKGLLSQARKHVCGTIYIDLECREYRQQRLPAMVLHLVGKLAKAVRP